MRIQHTYTHIHSIYNDSAYIPDLIPTLQESTDPDSDQRSRAED